MTDAGESSMLKTPWIGVPSAWATISLIGETCEVTTTVSPACDSSTWERPSSTRA